MKIKKIKLRNIRSYKDHEIEFGEGSTLLWGDIGSGKTSILMAIEFALFGLQPGQRGASLLKNGEDDAEVVIEIEVEGKRIIIERRLKKGKTISQDYCAISVDGEKEEVAVTELKNKVLTLLNYPLEFSKKQNVLYKFTVYTPQEEMKQIILQDSETRINTLRHVFGIDKYKRILENVSLVNAKIREEKKIKEGMTATLEEDRLNIISKEDEVAGKRSDLILLEEELNLKKNIREEKERELEEFRGKIEERNKLNQEIEKTKIMIHTKEDSIVNNEKTISQLKDAIFELESLRFDENKILELEDLVSIKKKEREKLSEKNVEISSRISSLKIKIEEQDKLEKKISSLEVCPTCLQDVDAVYRANVLNKARNEINTSKNEIEELENEKKRVFENLKEIDLAISKNEKEITDLKILKMKLQDLAEKRKRVLELDGNNNSMKKDIDFLRQHNENLMKNISELSKFENLFKEKDREREGAYREERIADIKVAELRKEIEMSLKQISELKEKVRRGEEVKKSLNYLYELEEWLNKKFVPIISFIEKNVMIKLKSEFSNLFSEWFGMLVSENFNVRLDDEFTPIIEQKDYELEYAYLSGGERTAIALAYRLSLNQVINSLLSKIKTKDLVILDEPTDGFSEAQLDKMRDVLQQLNVGQLIIVSHEQKIEGFVENVIKIHKNNLGSWVEG